MEINPDSLFRGWDWLLTLLINEPSAVNSRE